MKTKIKGGTLQLPHSRLWMHFFCANFGISLLTPNAPEAAQVDSRVGLLKGPHQERLLESEIQSLSPHCCRLSAPYILTSLGCVSFNVI